LTTASRLIAESLVWDNHGCMPLRHEDESFLPQLARYRNSGVDIASLNVGFDALPWENTIHMIAQFRRWIGLHSDHYRLVQSVGRSLDVNGVQPEQPAGWRLHG